MGMLTTLLTLPVTGPIQSVLWLAETLTDRAEQELYNPDTIRGKLMELELRYDMGAISEEEYLAAEEELLALLKYARQRQAEGG